MSKSGSLLRPYVRKHWTALATAGASTIVVAAADLARPFPLKFVIDRIFEKAGSPPFELARDDYMLLAVIGGLVLLIALADAVASYLMDVRLQQAGEHIVHDLRVSIYEHLQRLSLGFHERRHTGDLVTRLTGDVGAVGSLFADSLGSLISSSLTLIGMVIVALVLDPVLALVIFALSPVLAYLAFTFRAKIRSIAHRERAQDGHLASLSTETLSAMRVVKALGSETFEHDRLQRTSEERRRWGIRAAQVEGRFGGSIDILGAVGTAAVLVLGVLRVASGALSPGDLIVMLSYVKKMYRPLRDIARQANKVSQAMVRADRAAEILAADDVLEEGPGAADGPRAGGELELEGVSFAYEHGRPVLADLSLRIPKGQKLALVGRSGAGKSTLAALIARFYDPVSGRVLIDGQDLRTHKLSWLRRQVGLVLQDTVLFTGTVVENIAYGIDVDRARIEAVARTAGAHEFIRHLPQGYDTPLGPRGVALSGGQRQRIAVARTLLRDPSVLVLDEPTTGLDAESESQVLRGLNALMRGRTTIIITHSLSLARTAHRVAVMDEGRIIQEGTPDELLADHGPFRHLAEEQGLIPASIKSVAAPRDEALPQMTQLLDPGSIAPVLERSLGRDADLTELHVRRVRYAPGNRVVVHYGARVGERWHDAIVTVSARTDLGRRASRPENVALARIADGRSPAVTPLAYDTELGALIEWFPLDLSLPALAKPLSEIGERLEKAGVTILRGGDEPRLLSYRPRKRAVVRVGDHILKFHARDEAFQRAVAGLQAVGRLGRLRIAELEAAIPDLRLTAQPYVPGPVPPPSMEVSARAGSMLFSLHSSPVQGLLPFPPITQLEVATSRGRLAAAIVPSLRRRVESLVNRLAASMPDEQHLVLSHGDFHFDQMIDAGEELVMIDLDHLRMAAPAQDATSYAAYLLRDQHPRLEAVTPALEALLRGYGRWPESVPWYLSTGILRRANVPFRHLEDDWPQRVEGMVEAAELALVL